MSSDLQRRTSDNEAIEQESSDEQQYEWECVGVVGVDSGTILVCDPCYVGPHISPKRIHEELPSLITDKDEVCLTFLNDKIGYGKGTEGAGYMTKTWLGDGVYPVYVLKDDNGRAMELRIDFVEPWERMLEERQAGIPVDEDGPQFACVCSDLSQQETHIKDASRRR